MVSELRWQLLRIKSFFKRLFKRPIKVIILREDQVLVKHDGEWYIGNKKATEMKSDWTPHNHGFDNVKPTFKPKDSVSLPTPRWK